MTATQIITPFTDGIGGVIQALGGAIVDGFNTMFLETSGSTTTLTSLGTFILVMEGVSLALGLGYIVLNLFRTRRQ